MALISVFHSPQPETSLHCTDTGLVHRVVCLLLLVLIAATHRDGQAELTESLTTHPIDGLALMSADADAYEAADDDVLEIGHETPALESVSRKPD